MQKWKEDLLKSLKSRVKAAEKKNDDIWGDLKEVILNIKRESFLKAIANLTTMRSSKIEDMESKKILKGSFAHQITQRHVEREIHLS